MSGTPGSNTPAYALPGEEHTIDNAELMHRFAYHPATTPWRRDAHEGVRSLLGHTAAQLVDLVPDGRERALALTNLEQAMFWANAAIARQLGDALGLDDGGTNAVAPRRPGSVQ